MVRGRGGRGVYFFAVGERQEEGVPALLPDLPIAFHPPARRIYRLERWPASVKTLVEEKRSKGCPACSWVGQGWWGPQ